MYYLIEKTIVNNATAKAIWDKETLDIATMALHQTMASAIANQNCASALTMIIDEVGAVQRYEYWERQIIEEPAE